MTHNEVERLWLGMKLWNEEVENAQEGKSSKHAEATAADKRHFNELANANGETAAS